MVAYIASPSWETQAACRGAESARFVPPVNGESDRQRRDREKAAKHICAQCPVKTDCLEYALRVHEPFGIWGGLNEPERRQLQASGRKLQAAPAVTKKKKGNKGKTSKKGRRTTTPA